MGQVYLGRSPGGRLVAIKVIRDEITDHPEALSRFRREANTVRAVRSAYTANLMDASLESAPYWIATEYVTGPTLAHAVRERGAFPVDTVRGLCAALAEGLASVHAYDVTHRDLKPMNVILAGQGPQLIDFGIARGVGDTALTVTGMAPGTPGFTAPEVLIRNQVGPEADVFALGATVAYAATGRPPFGSGPTDAVSYRAVHEPIDLDGVEDAGLVELVRACVAKEPGERPTPEEVIRRCGVRGALVDDPFYGAVVGGLGDSVPDVPDVLHELPTGGPGLGYVPTLDGAGGGTAAAAPDRAGRRARPWVVAAAVGAVVGVSVAGTVWLTSLKDEGGTNGGAQGAGPQTPGAGTGKQTQAASSGGGGTAGGAKTSPPGGGAADPAKSEEPVGPPQYMVQTGPSNDWWSSKNGRCNAKEEEDAHLQFQFSVATDADDYANEIEPGKVKIGFRLKFPEPGAAPYYVAVTAKPGVKGSGLNNTDLGYQSKVQDLYAGDETEWKYLTYPDDFTERTADGKTGPALATERAPGSWTVVYHHVRGVKDHKSVVCAGFQTL